MKRTILTCGALLLFSVPQMFAAITMQLTLTAGATTCTIDVNTGSVITTSGTCSGLNETVTGGDNGKLEVNSTAPGSFGGFSVSDIAEGHGYVSVPQLQDVNQTNVAKTTAASTEDFTSFFTDTSVLTTASTFGVTTTLNSVTLAGTGDFYAFNSNTNAVPATTLIGSQIGLAGPSTSTYNVYPNPSPGVPYSLASEIVLHFTALNQAVSASQQISAATVPEPASIMLMGTMLLLTGFGLRRKLSRG